jgi:hypothetical protein
LGADARSRCPPSIILSVYKLDAVEALDALIAGRP